MAESLGSSLEQSSKENRHEVPYKVNDMEIEGLHMRRFVVAVTSHARARSLSWLSDRSLHRDANNFLVYNFYIDFCLPSIVVKFAEVQCTAEYTLGTIYLKNCICLYGQKAAARPKGRVC